VELVNAAAPVNVTATPAVLAVAVPVTTCWLLCAVPLLE
jgi:hypothetical protein